MNRPRVRSEAVGSALLLSNTRRTAAALLLFLTAVMPLGAQQNSLPPELDGVGVEQRLGLSLPLDAPFLNSKGETVRLGELLDTNPAIASIGIANASTKPASRIFGYQDFDRQR